ncbi:arylesterase [Janthinobacterium fluminis]|uniref:Arylesterase n=1 Tax=Janthinobacterium fluminis TaxID=2987524 RepID=A0ABT5JVF9_9BURK|nr:arylesterase [Janthinobacterium fluminis]MDC8756728.1 arylesterase [Janthinobacterium fluminis]
MLIYLKKLREHIRGHAGQVLRRRRLLLSLPVAALLFAAGTTSAYSAPKTVLVLGDSLSAEYGLSRGNGWVALLERRLATQKIDAAIVNASISGETTSGGRTRLPALLSKYRPQIVVIELGANDGLRGLPVAAAEANLQAMSAQAHQAGAKVLLVGMRMPPNYGRDYADKFFAMYGKLAKDLRAPLVPFMLDGVADKAQLFQPDRLHPTAEAHPIILANIWPQLLPLLKVR